MISFAGINLQHLNEIDITSLKDIQQQFKACYREKLNKSHGGNSREAYALRQLYIMQRSMQSATMQAILYLEKHQKITRLAKFDPDKLDENKLNSLMAIVLRFMPDKVLTKELDYDDLFFLNARQLITYFNIDVNNDAELIDLIENVQEDLDCMDNWKASVLTALEALENKILSRVPFNLAKINRASERVNFKEILPYVIAIQIDCYIDLLLYFSKQKYNPDSHRYAEAVERLLKAKFADLKYLPELPVQHKNEQHHGYSALLFIPCLGKPKAATNPFYNRELPSVNQ